MVKPVDEEELIARINAVMRRVHHEEKGILNQYRIGKYLFDFTEQYLLLDEKKQFVTAREAAILRMLCEQRGKILDRKQTLNRLWGANDYFARRSMDVFISHLRKYLAEDPSVEIRNVHGKGYVLSE